MTPHKDPGYDWPSLLKGVMSHLLCWSSQALASIHGGLNIRAPSIGNTSKCIHPQRASGFGKLGTCLILMVSTPSASSLSLTLPRLCRHLCPKCALALPLLDASLCSQLFCGFLDIGNLDLALLTSVTSSMYNFLDHVYSFSFLATLTLAQRVTALFEHSSHNVCTLLLWLLGMLEYIRISPDMLEYIMIFTDMIY
jgi:hypothetical protein